MVRIPFISFFALLLVHSAFCQDNSKQGYVCAVSYDGIKDKGVIELQKNTCLPLQLTLEGCDTNCEVASFDLNVTANGVAYTEHANGKYLTAGMCSLIRKLGHDSHMLFYNIRYSAPGGGKRAIMHSISITLK